MRTVRVVGKRDVTVLRLRDEVPRVPRRLEAQADELRRQQEAKDRPRRFLDWWKQEMHARKLEYTWDPADLKLATKLLQQHDMDALCARARYFFTHKSEPLYEGTYNRSLILFAHELDTIEVELESHV